MSVANKLRKLLTKNLVDVAQALVGVEIAGEVVTDDLSAAGVEVGEGNILRLEVGADTYVAFSDDSSIGAVSAATTNGIKLAAGYHKVVCSCKYVRTSANPTRVELLKL